MAAFVPNEHPSAGPRAINVSVIRPWSLLLPRVYRLMDSKYVDAFFEDGSLMLSSYSRFAKHADEERRDETEGLTTIATTGPHGASFMAVGRGHNCYVLCGSTAYTEVIRAAFSDSDGCLVIDDPAEFASSVSSYVPGFTGGASGLCIYQDVPGIHRHSEVNFKERLAEDMVNRLQDDGGGEEQLFLKQARFASQLEYRILWASGAPMQDRLHIKCPEARRFCRRPNSSGV